MRNQAEVVEHRNGLKIHKIWVLELKECIKIFQVVCLDSYYSETSNQMHVDTSFRNGSGASTKWRETFKNMSFGPKVVDWAFLLQKKRNSSRGINSCIKCISISVSAFDWMVQNSTTLDILLERFQCTPLGPKLKFLVFSHHFSALKCPFGFAPRTLRLKLVFWVISRPFIAAPGPLWKSVSGAFNARVYASETISCFIAMNMLNPLF